MWKMPFEARRPAVVQYYRERKYAGRSVFAAFPYGPDRVVDSLFVSHYGENALSAVSYVLGNAIGIYGIWWSFLISETVTVVFALLHLAGTEKKELERIAPVL